MLKGFIFPILCNSWLMVILLMTLPSLSLRRRTMSNGPYIASIFFFKLRDLVFNGKRPNVIAKLSFPCQLGLTLLDGSGLVTGKSFIFAGFHLHIKPHSPSCGKHLLLQVIKHFNIGSPISSCWLVSFIFAPKNFTATHVYYSSCWVPSKASYLKIKKLLHEFLWASCDGNHDFHHVSWDFCCLPHDVGGLGIISIHQ